MDNCERVSLKTNKTRGRLLLLVDDELKSSVSPTRINSKNYKESQTKIEDELFIEFREDYASTRSCSRHTSHKASFKSFSDLNFLNNFVESSSGKCLKSEIELFSSISQNTHFNKNVQKNLKFEKKLSSNSGENVVYISLEKLRDLAKSLKTEINFTHEKKFHRKTSDFNKKKLFWEIDKNINEKEENFKFLDEKYKSPTKENKFNSRKTTKNCSNTTLASYNLINSLCDDLMKRFQGKDKLNLSTSFNVNHVIQEEDSLSRELSARNPYKSHKILIQLIRMDQGEEYDIEEII